jgi:hypothetical protein
MNFNLTEFDKNMSAVAFAEAGEHETATAFLKKEQTETEERQEYALKKKPYAGMVTFGALSLTAYIALMTHQSWVSETYTMGGWHALYPVVTALIFSFVHGAFASNLLSVLGIEAKK